LYQPNDTQQPQVNITSSEWAREDVALVIACDGLYDVMDDQLIAEIACPWMCWNDFDLFNDPIFDNVFSEVLRGNSTERLRYGCKCVHVGKGCLAELAAVRLRTAADALESMDNVSLVVVML
jgi:serine/threonine protein phosphatase PrpC